MLEGCPREEEGSPDWNQQGVEGGAAEAVPLQHAGRLKAEAISS